MDETWIHDYTSETKRSSSEWTAAGESCPKRQKTQQWAGKVMASVFWDAHPISFIDHLEKGKTINSDYYMASLGRLSAEIKKKRPHMQKKKVLFHQDNALYHKSMKAMVKFNELSFELLPHSPYSSYLVPSDYKALWWPEKNAPGIVICLQCRSDCRNWGPFWEQRRIILQKRHRKVREALKWMYCAWRKLFWWIKSNFSKKLCFS